MNIKEITFYLSSSKIPYESDVDLKKKTWIHRGGHAKYYITPINKEQLIELIRFLYANKFSFFIVGHTSNIFIQNTTNVDVVVSTIKCNKYFLRDDVIECEAGAGIIRMSHDLIHKGVKGFEYLTGLPGTVAGAICNNSSCRSNSISDLLISAEVILSDGRLVTLYHDDFKFKFRTSVFKDKEVNGVIISAKLKVKYDDPNVLQKIAVANQEDRKVRLEGHSKNLGCTVNCTFSNGKMPLKYYIPWRIYSKLVYIFIRDKSRRMSLCKNYLCMVSGYSHVAPYISNVNPIIFLWLDANADNVFSDYLEFMKLVYKTEKIEIEIL